MNIATVAPVNRVAFIGLGVMGLPMARNLCGAGLTVIAYSRTHSVAAALEGDGATAAASVRDAVKDVDAVVIMLPDTTDVVGILEGDEGVFAVAKPGTLIIDMSSISPVATRRLAGNAERSGHQFIDAPVSGGERGAIAATLSIMAGGPSDAVERARPLLRLLGSSVVRVGAAGSGQVAKACNQLIVAATIQAVAEALTLAAEANVEPSSIVEAIRGGFAGSRVLEVHGERMLARDFTPGFRSALHLKDARIVLEAASEYGVQLPAFAVVAQQLRALVDSGGGDLDHSALITLLDGT